MNLRSPLRAGRSGVLSNRPFRRLWVALSLSSLGDWLSLVALSALANDLGGRSGQYAVSGVWLSSLLPALIIGPVAAAVAARLDQRLSMIVFDLARAALYLSIPVNLALGVADRLTWLYVAQFLASCASMFRTAAQDASVPDLVPPQQLTQASQLSLLTTYGAAPAAGLAFAVLAVVSRLLGHISHYFAANQVSLALYVSAVTFAAAAVTVYRLGKIARRGHAVPATAAPPVARAVAPSVARSVRDGWRLAGQSVNARGIVTGVTGALAVGGLVLGLGPPYVKTILAGGYAGWGLVFAAIFIGLAAGMFFGLRIFPGLSRHRLFGLSIAFAALPLALIAVIPDLGAVIALVLLLGACAGVACVTGYTIIGLAADDGARSRQFAFPQPAIRVILFAVIAVAPALAGGTTALLETVTGHATPRIAGISYHTAGYSLVLLAASLAAAALGRVSYRQMDDRRGVPLLTDLTAVLRGAEPPPLTGRESRRPDAPAHRGLLLALEGGEGAGKSTQSRLLAIWLREQGFDVLATHEPGATKVGMRLRALLLDRAHTGLSPRAEAMMYAADRAEHVARVMNPALARGAIVVTDRYVDSSLAYQGAGRMLPVTEIATMNQWATGGLVPDLTILLDLPPAVGLGRRATSADRLEAEPTEFHERVRAGFQELAQAEPGRYLVLDALRDTTDLSREVQHRVRGLLPDPVPLTAEEITSSIPAVRE